MEYTQVNQHQGLINSLVGQHKDQVRRANQSIAESNAKVEERRKQYESTIKRTIEFLATA